MFAVEILGYKRVRVIRISADNMAHATQLAKIMHPRSEWVSVSRVL